MNRRDVLTAVSRLPLSLFLAFGFLLPAPAFSADLKDDAYIPGFELPAEYAELPAMEPKCQRERAIDGWKVCGPLASEFVFEYYEGTQLLGQLFAAIDPDGTAAWVSRYQVAEASRGKGLSTKLLRKLIEKAGPQLMVIGGALAATNYQAFNEPYYRLTVGCGKKLSRTKANAAALKETPFYKSLARLGFSEVANLTVHWVKGDKPFISEISVELKKVSPSR